LFILENVTVVEVKGENKKAKIIVSNDLIHQFISRKKEKGVFHWYFYIKENVNACSLNDNIWISKKQSEEIQNLFFITGKEKIFIEEDRNLSLRVVQGQVLIDF
jgi:hypothetical protein